MNHTLRFRMLSLGTVLLASSAVAWAASAVSTSSAPASGPAATVAAPASMPATAASGAAKPAVSATAPAVSTGAPADIMLGEGDRISPIMPVTPDGKTALMTIMLAGAANPPNAGPVVVAARRNNVYVIDLATGTARDISAFGAESPGTVSTAAFSPDSKYALVVPTSSRDTSAYVIDLARGKSTPLSVSATARPAGWAGDKIAIRQSSSTHPIKLVSADGANETETEFRISFLSASRDGKAWVASGNPDDLAKYLTTSKAQVMLMTPEGKVVRQLGPYMEVTVPIILSPSGTYVAFTRRVRSAPPNAGYRRSIVVVEVKSGTEVEAAANAAGAMTPLSLTDDGRLVASETVTNIINNVAETKVKVSIYDTAGIPTTLVEDAICAGANDKSVFYAALKNDVLEFASKDLPPAKK